MRTIVLILLYFFIYSFLGWVVESVYGSIKARKWIKRRGVFTSYFLPLYGGCADMIIGVFQMIRSPLIAAIVSALLVTAFEYLIGWSLDQEMGVRLWDYSGHKWHIGGYVCAAYTVMWGVLAYILATWVHPYVAWLVRGWAGIPQLLVLIALAILYAADVAATEGKEALF